MVTNPNCERCTIVPRIPAERFCNKCRKAVLAELQAAGYLQRVPFTHPRPVECREVVRETKFGLDR